MSTFVGRLGNRTYHSFEEFKRDIMMHGRGKKKITKVMFYTDRATFVTATGQRQEYLGERVLAHGDVMSEASVGCVWVYVGEGSAKGFWKLNWSNRVRVG